MPYQLHILQFITVTGEPVVALAKYFGTQLRDHIQQSILYPFSACRALCNISDCLLFSSSPLEYYKRNYTAYKNFCQIFNYLCLIFERIFSAVSMAFAYRLSKVMVNSPAVSTISPVKFDLKSRILYSASLISGLGATPCIS